MASPPTASSPPPSKAPLPSPPPPHPPAAPATPPPAHRRYWRRTLKLTGWLLAAWLVVTLGIGGFAQHWTFTLLGWPVGFWMASQGALLLYVVIVWIYALGMDRLDREYAVASNEAPPR